MTRLEDRKRALRTLDEHIAAYRNTVEVLAAEHAKANSVLEAQDLERRVEAMKVQMEGLLGVRKYITSAGSIPSGKRLRQNHL